MSGSSDPEREHALEQYKAKLLESREWEAKLKALRLEIKGLQHDFDVSEDNIKALQSVGQIIGEVLKQLDEERCMFITTGYCIGSISLTRRSYREGIIRTTLCCWMPVKGRQGEVETGNSSCAGYDNTHHHANAASRSRSPRIQHVAGRSRSSQLW